MRCFLFSLLWSLTTYLHVLSLKILGATEVASLLATSVSFVYLMAWVVLHEEFVGTRVSAHMRAAKEGGCVNTTPPKLSSRNPKHDILYLTMLLGPLAQHYY